MGQAIEGRPRKRGTDLSFESDSALEVHYHPLGLDGVFDVRGHSPRCPRG